MPGTLTTALNTAKTTLGQFTAIPSLPPQAQAIQNQVAAGMNPLLTATPPFQTALLGYLQQAIPQLQSVLSQLKGGADPAGVRQTLTAITGNFAAFGQQAAPIVADAGNARNVISQAESDTAGVEQQLQGQIASINGQIGAAQSEEDAAKKRYYWLLALGPFGLAGLAAALALYLKWKSDISDLQDKINGLNAQIGPIQAMIAACKTLASAAGQLVSAIDGLQNAIDAVGDDCAEIVANLSNASELELFINATIGVMQTLEADAS